MKKILLTLSLLTALAAGAAAVSVAVDEHGYGGLAVDEHGYGIFAVDEHGYSPLAVDEHGYSIDV
ncbi:hypothetical protein [Effusibacillus pohliae]|uniref:hypothetical protein n=1 Tax=Effusibacillus pohliae TaxID=232270 RepID=UPI0003810842|nr:hypothetical protein [Effusibacillus pohliae]